MDSVFLFLQFCRLVVGERLCFGEKATVGKPRIYVWPHAAALRVRGSYRADQHDGSTGEHTSDFSVWNDGSDAFRVRDWSRDGADFPGEVLGLQQPEVQFERIYLCIVITVLGGFSVLLVRIVHVPVETVVLKLPLIAADGIAFGLVAVAAVDLTQSFNEAMDMKRILTQLEESKEQIRKLEEKIRSVSAEVMADYRQRYETAAEEYRKRADERKQEKLSRKEAFWSVSA